MQHTKIEIREARTLLGKAKKAAGLAAWHTRTTVDLLESGIVSKLFPSLPSSYRGALENLYQLDKELNAALEKMYE